MFLLLSTDLLLYKEDDMSEAQLERLHEKIFLDGKADLFAYNLKIYEDELKALEDYTNSMGDEFNGTFQVPAFFKIEDDENKWGYGMIALPMDRSGRQIEREHTVGLVMCFPSYKERFPPYNRAEYPDVGDWIDERIVRNVADMRDRLAVISSEKSGTATIQEQVTKELSESSFIQKHNIDTSLLQSSSRLSNTPNIWEVLETLEQLNVKTVNEDELIKLLNYPKFDIDGKKI